MVDRAARRQLALLLRRYASGRIDEAQMIEGLSWRRHSDPVIDELSNAAAFLDEDYIGTDKPGRWSGAITRHDVARWVLFLMSDEEYRWPEMNFRVLEWVEWFSAWVFVGSAGFLIALVRLQQCEPWLLGLATTVSVLAIGVTPFLGGLRSWQARRQGADPSLWPFHDAEQYARAAARHPFAGATGAREPQGG